MRLCTLDRVVRAATLTLLHGWFRSNTLPPGSVGLPARGQRCRAWTSEPFRPSDRVRMTSSSGCEITDSVGHPATMTEADRGDRNATWAGTALPTPSTLGLFALLLAVSALLVRVSAAFPPDALLSHEKSPACSQPLRVVPASASRHTVGMTRSWISFGPPDATRTPRYGQASANAGPSSSAPRVKRKPELGAANAATSRKSSTAGAVPEAGFRVLAE